jgi:RecA-family ATPase
VSEGKIYSLEELLAEVEESAPLIEGLLWQNDNILLVGHEKAGKSVLGMQLAFALSSGQPLFGEFPVTKKCKVLYIQAEGKLSETKERTVNMMKTEDVDKDNYWLAYEPSIALDTEEGYQRFVKKIDEKKVKPDVIILDPLYHSMQGSLIDEKDARAMTSHLRLLSQRYDATLVVVHHTHRAIRNEGGTLISEGDKAMFGSFVWSAFADHILLLSKGKDGLMRILTCDTQRSGKVIGRQELTFNVKETLSFSRKEDEHKPYELSVRQFVEKKGQATRQEVVDATKHSLSTVEKSLKKLVIAGEVMKVVGKYPVVYKSKACAPQVAET